MTASIRQCGNNRYNEGSEGEIVVKLNYRLNNIMAMRKSARHMWRRVNAAGKSMVIKLNACGDP